MINYSVAEAVVGFGLPPETGGQLQIGARAFCDQTGPCLDGPPGVLVVREDADERAVHDEPGGLEGVAGGTGGRDALGLGADQRLGAREVRLP